MKSDKFRLILVLLLCNASISDAWSANIDSIAVLQTENDTVPPQIQFLSLKDTTHNYSDNNYSFKKSFWPAMSSSFIYNSAMGGFLLMMPDRITNWHKQDKFQYKVMKNQYISSFSKPPIIDNDLWYINFLGHPYQGAHYFNSIRSQGGSFWESTLFNLGQSTIWEYLWEGGLEQPSIQDLIVTPILGTLAGELAHKATIAMSKNGFVWYEKLTICLINPSYVFNNGFKIRPYLRKR